MSAMGMRMDLILRQRLEQRLKLAPQIIQSIQILQLPAIDLRELVQKELVENPLVEIKESPEAEQLPPLPEEALHERLGTSVLLKGGHGDEAVITDLLLSEGRMTAMTSQRRRGSFHGTGCALSAGIAAYLARGVNLLDAVKASRALLTEGMDAAYLPGKGDLHYMKL